jgi:rhodanese-related sulfurtransferase
VALQLRQAGLVNVRPLAGGFEAWHELGFPTEAVFENMESHADAAR